MFIRAVREPDLLSVAENRLAYTSVFFAIMFSLLLLNAILFKGHIISW